MPIAVHFAKWRFYNYHIMFGQDFNLENDDRILEINSPKVSVGGPYSVVFKSIEDRFAVVALDWDGNPKLAIRWFWNKNGNPSSRGYATWFVIPSMLLNAVLNGFPLDFEYRDKVNRFLAGEIDGHSLKKG